MLYLAKKCSVQKHHTSTHTFWGNNAFALMKLSVYLCSSASDSKWWILKSGCWAVPPRQCSVQKHCILKFEKKICILYKNAHWQKHHISVRTFFLEIPFVVTMLLHRLLQLTFYSLCSLASNGRFRILKSACCPTPASILTIPSSPSILIKTPVWSRFSPSITFTCRKKKKLLESVWWWLQTIILQGWESVNDFEWSVSKRADCQSFNTIGWYWMLRQ